MIASYFQGSFRRFKTYCWWFRIPKHPPFGCIPNPVKHGIFTISTGAGFGPSPGNLSTFHPPPINSGLGGGNSNIFYVHPYLGKLPILTNIFQLGWNHQLVDFVPIWLLAPGVFWLRESEELVWDRYSGSKEESLEPTDPVTGPPKKKTFQMILIKLHLGRYGSGECIYLTPNGCQNLGLDPLAMNTHFHHKVPLTYGPLVSSFSFLFDKKIALGDCDSSEVTI